MNFENSKIELQHLRWFIKVAEEGSITEAAKKLYTPQPHLSNKIKALEEYIGGSRGVLFDRRSHPLKLTQAGEKFLVEARSILAQLEQTIQLTKKISRGEVGFLNIGFTSSIANSILPEVLNRFCAEFPKVELNCRQMASDRQVQELQNNQIDVALFHPNHRAVKDNNLDSLTILSEPLVLVMPENHPLNANSKIPLQVLAGENFVLPTRQSFSGLSEQIHLLFDRVGFAPKIAQEATNMVTVLGLVAGGMGIGLLPSNALNFQRKGVIYKEIEGVNSIIETMMVWQRNNSSNILEQFRAVTKSVAQSR